jgi:hypothetical protein
MSVFCCRQVEKKREKDAEKERKNKGKELASE